MNKTGIIIQARTGSTRLPNKILLPFYDGKSILEIIVDKIKNITDITIVIATTINEKDDAIVNIANKLGVKSFRGSEDNVLQRFIDASKNYGFENVIRICSDNPFLDIAEFKKIIDKSKKFNKDYFSFILANKRPVIKSHFGFWTELVKVSALQEVLNHKPAKKHLEHVTIFIYENPEIFKVEFIDAPSSVYNRTNIRLTIDTEIDFSISTDIYTKLIAKNSNFGINDIVKYLDENKENLEIMNEEISKNEKK